MDLGCLESMTFSLSEELVRLEQIYDSYYVVDQRATLSRYVVKYECDPTAADFMELVYVAVFPLVVHLKHDH